jgi:hypothetical protein
MSLFGTLSGTLRSSVHVVGKGDEAGGVAPGQHFIGAAHEGRAQHFLKRADMGKPRGTIAGLEQHRHQFAVRILFASGVALTSQRFLEGPGLGDLGGGDEIGLGHGSRPFAIPARLCKVFGARLVVPCGRFLSRMGRAGCTS